MGSARLAMAGHGWPWLVMVMVGCGRLRLLVVESCTIRVCGYQQPCETCNVEANHYGGLQEFSPQSSCPNAHFSNLDGYWTKKVNVGGYAITNLGVGLPRSSYKSGV